MSVDVTDEAIRKVIAALRNDAIHKSVAQAFGDAAFVNWCEGQERLAMMLDTMMTERKLLLSIIRGQTSRLEDAKVAKSHRGKKGA